MARRAVLAFALGWAVPAAASTELAPVSGPDGLSTVSQRHMVRVEPPGRPATYLLAVQNGGIPPAGTSAWLTWWRSDDEGATWRPYRPILSTQDHLVTDLVVVGSDVAAVYSYDTTDTTFPQDSARDPGRKVFFQWWRYDGAGDWNAGPLVEVAAPPGGQAYHRAVIAADSLGRLWIQAWLRDGCAFCGDTARLWVSTDGGSQFSSQGAVAHVGLLGGGRILSLGTKLVLLWGDYSWDDPAQLMVRDDAAPLGSWTGPVNAFSDGDSIYHGAALQAVADGRGGMHLVYKARTEDLWYRHFDGSAFGARQFVDGPGDWALQPASTTQNGEFFVWTNHPVVGNSYYQIRLYRLSRGFGSWDLVDDVFDFKGYGTSPEVIPPGDPLTCAYVQGWWGSSRVVVAQAASPFPVADFDVSAAPATLAGDAGATITLAPRGGYSGTVALTVGGLPQGASATFASPRLAIGPGPSSTTLALSSGTAAPGTYPLTVTAVDDAGLRHAAAIAWTVSARTVPDFTVVLAPASLADRGTVAVTVARSGGFGADVLLSVSGVPGGATATLGSSTLGATQGSTTLTLSGDAAAPGTYTVTVTASGGGITHAATLAFTISPRVAPDFTVAVSPVAVADAGAATVTVTPVGGYGGTVALAVSGVPAGALARLDSATVAIGPGPATTALTLGAGSAVSGSYLVTVTASDAAGTRHAASLTYSISASGTNPPIATLVDPFTGPGLSALWTVQAGSGSQATAGNGTLSLAPAQAGGVQGATVKSARSWRLTGSAVQIHVAGTVNQRAAVNEKFRVQGPAPMGWDDTLGFWLESGVLYAFYNAGGVETDVAAVPFSATTHAWWRVGESAGTIVWQTSPDGVAWTRLASTPSGSLRFSTDAVDLVFDAVAFGNGATAYGQAQFTDLDRAATATDFALAASPSALSDDGASTITMTPVNGYAGTATLTLGGVPAGATAALDATTLAAGPGPGSTTLTLSAGTAAAGTYGVTIAATDGTGLRRTASIAYTVSPRAVPDFGVSVAPAALADDGAVTVSVAPANGFTGTVALSVSGAPSGASATLGASSVSVGPGSASTALTLVRGGAPAGTYSLRVTASAAGLTRSAPLAWTVSTTTGGGGGGSGPPPSGPPDVATLVDPFSGPGLSSLWTVETLTGGSAASAAGGVLTVAPGQDAGFTGAFVKTAQAWRLTGSSVHVQVAGTVNPAGGANQKFRVQVPGPLDWSDTFGFWLEGSVLYPFYTVNGSDTSITALPFSPTEHAWWSLREANGTILFETSPDGRTWTQRASMPAGTVRFSTDQVNVVFDAISFSGGGAPGAARFTALNR